MIYIYALVDPRTGEARYVGKTNNPKSRLASHLCMPSRNCPKRRAAWLNELGSLDLEPSMKILEELPDDADWGVAEARWQAKFPNLLSSPASAGVGRRKHEPGTPYSGKFVVRMTPGLHERVAKVAGAERRSLNDQVVLFLEQAVERAERKAGK